MVLKVLVNDLGAMIILLDLSFPELDETGQPFSSTADEELLEESDEALEESLEASDELLDESLDEESVELEDVVEEEDEERCLFFPPDS